MKHPVLIAVLFGHVFLQVFSDAFCPAQGVLLCSMPCTQPPKPLWPKTDFPCAAEHNSFGYHTGTDAVEQQWDGDVDTYCSLVRVCVITVLVCPQEWLSLQNKAN